MYHPKIVQKRLDSIARKHNWEPCFNARAMGFQLGIGMSARSHLRDTVYRNHRNMSEYLSRIEAGRSPVEHTFFLDEESRRTQYIARSLGDGKVLSRAAYAEAFSRPLEVDYAVPLSRMLEAGLVDDENGELKLSPVGQLLYDRVMISFYPKRALDWLWAHQ